jgi:hypothetical protein
MTACDAPGSLRRGRFTARHVCKNHIHSKALALDQPLGLIFFCGRHLGHDLIAAGVLDASHRIFEVAAFAGWFDWIVHVAQAAHAMAGIMATPMSKTAATATFISKRPMIKTGWRRG